MTPDALTDDERERADAISKLSDDEIEKILHYACRVLSSLTHYTSVATPPQVQETRIRRIHVSAVEPTRLLVVVILSTGEIKHRIVECREVSSREDLYSPTSSTSGCPRPAQGRCLRSCSARFRQRFPAWPIWRSTS